MTAAVLFQFMPPLLPSEYVALTESIRAHGVSRMGLDPLTTRAA